MRNWLMMLALLAVVGCNETEGETYSVESGAMTGACDGVPLLTAVTFYSDGTGTVDTKQGSIDVTWTDVFGFRTVDMTAHGLSGLVLFHEEDGTWTDDRWVVTTPGGECIVEPVILR